MNVRGGRAARGLFAAAAIALLLVPIFPVAPAQGAGDPWWGASERGAPTEGWAVRVPVVVENKHGYDLRDPFVAVELDLSRLLVEAGWTNATTGAGVNARGFTLDVDSIRVVPYGAGFVSGPVDGPAQKPLAHRFYPSLFETPRAREFDATRPAGTVLFQIPGTLRPEEKRSFYIYADPLEYGDTPAPAFDPLDMGPLDAFMWGTRGNVYLGFEPNQEGQTTHFERVLAITKGATLVTVYTYEIGGFRKVPSSSTLQNPFVLQQGQWRDVPIPAGKPFKIEGDKPILVWGYGTSSPGEAVPERFGFVPGLSGSFADNEFNLQGWAPGFNVQGGQAMQVRVVKAGPGTFTVAGPVGSSTTLSAANPIGTVYVPYPPLPGDLRTIRSPEGGKFAVSLQLAGTTANFPRPLHTYQLPALSGGPSGTDFFAYPSVDNGFIRVCPESNATIRLVAGTNLQIHPEGSLPNVPPAVFEKQAFCHEVPVPRTAPATEYSFYSTKEDVDPQPGSPVSFRAFIGAGVRVTDPTNNLTRPMIGHYGGLGGIDYYTYGPTGLFGHYNETRITVFEERSRAGQTTIVNYTRALQRDEFFAIGVPAHADATGRYRILATKPLAAASLAEATYKQEDAQGEQITINVPYVRHVPGRPVMPSVTVGALEWRGPLVDLVSPETPNRQDFKTTGPGTPLEYRLDVRNLGRWLQGGTLEDTVVVTCSTPAGWTIEGCAREIALSGGSTERLSVVVTPSMEDVNQSRTILVEAKSKSGGPVATFKLSVRVEIRYGVGMWFDVEGGRKTLDPPIGLSPGETYRTTIVLKNTGSTTDRFALRLEKAAEGWEHALLLGEDPVTSVLLEGGESVLLTYRVVAPDAEQGPQNLVSITARSESSALAADVVYPGTRIRPKIDLQVALSPQTQIAAPGETAVFNVTTRNKGNDVFTVLFRQDSVLPAGWSAELATDEVSLNPNDTFVTQLRVTPVAGARAGDLASLKLTAEVDAGAGRVAGDEVSAVVVVRRVYDLSMPPIFDVEASPDETVFVSLPVLNAGNGQVEIELLEGAVEAVLLQAGDELPVADWRVRLLDTEIVLGLNETTELPLRIEVPPLTAPGLYNVTFTTRLSREALQNLTLPVQVSALARVELDGLPRIGLSPGRAQSLALVARNTGNVEGEYELGAELPAGWNATFSPARVNLAPGERADVRVSLETSRDAADGVVDVELRATLDGHEPTARPLIVQVARPELYLDAAKGSGDLKPGELVLVTATVGNRGGIAAENVSVALVVDGRVVDRVLLARIPVGSTTIATLSWVATQRGGAVSVVLDPEEEISLASRDGTAQEVSFGSRLDVPAPSALLALALAGASALALRARRERR